MKKILFALPVVALLASCGVNPHAAKSAIEAYGMTNVEIGGYAFFGCGKDDFSSSFKATGVNGKPVSGVVCSGLLKGVTVRFD